MSNSLDQSGSGPAPASRRISVAGRLRRGAVILPEKAGAIPGAPFGGQGPAPLLRQVRQVQLPVDDAAGGEFIDAEFQPALLARIEALTECPFCCEPVRSRARKCPHCRETLDVVLRASEEAARAALLSRQTTGQPGIAHYTNSVIVNAPHRSADRRRRDFPHMLHFLMACVTFENVATNLDLRLRDHEAK